jgi:hypothetical protein
VVGSTHKFVITFGAKLKLLAYDFQSARRVKVCDAKMNQMAKASVRDLRYRFAEVEGLLGEGEEIQITNHKAQASYRHAGSR